VSVGCSHNRCTFCPTYKKDKFKIKEEEIIFSDIIETKDYDFKRAFLTGGDSLILPTEKLLLILNKIKKYHPRVERVGIYGNTKSILKKSQDDLNEQEIIMEKCWIPKYS
jgi:radical SAM superfamily enzyme YgiQ (UPF0313 family)